MWGVGARIELKSPREIELMRAAGQLVCQVLDELEQMARPGVSTLEMDAVASRMITEAGAKALFFGVEHAQAKFPFPASICASVNEAVVHGIPDDRPLEDGDIVSVDCGVRLKGYCGDSARTFAIGKVADETAQLLRVTRETLELAIREMKPHKRWSTVARKMQQHVEQAGFGVVREFVGHGIGREMWEEPKVPNYVDREGRGDFQLLPGVTIAVEPMVSLGSPKVCFGDRDGWKVITRDRSPAAHFEHSLAMTEAGVEILTRP